MKKSVYDAQPRKTMEESVAGNFPAKTGKSIDEWVEIVKKSGPPSEKERREWLKAKHGLTTNYAWFVAERAASDLSLVERYDPEAFVAEIFNGPKAASEPIYEAILAFALTLGNDVAVRPCKTMIPFYRKHVFGQVRVPNRSRLDLGFALKDMLLSGRLIDTGGFAKKDRITHRIEIATLKDFDAEAKRWLRTAYELDK